MAKDPNLALIATVAIVGCVAIIGILVLYFGITTTANNYAGKAAMAGSAISSLDLDTVKSCVSICDYVEELKQTEGIEFDQEAWAKCFSGCISSV